jgi:hypothetical protein
MAEKNRREILAASVAGIVAATLTNGANAMAAQDEKIKLSAKDVSKLSHALQQAHFRKQMVDDPDSALRSQGLDTALDKHFLDALKALTPGELDAVASVQAKAAAAGVVTIDSINGYLLF